MSRLKVGYDNNTSNLLVKFAVQRADGSWDLSGLLTRPCYEAWVATRRTLPQQLEVAFKDAVLTLIRERDCRTTLPPDMQSALLVELRKRRVWPCFEGYSDASGRPITIGATGFRGKGQYEKQGSASPQSVARSGTSAAQGSTNLLAAGVTDSPPSENEGEDDDEDDSTELRHAMMTLLDETPLPLPPQPPKQQDRQDHHHQQQEQQLQLRLQNLQHLQQQHLQEQHLQEQHLQQQQKHLEQQHLQHMLHLQQMQHPPIGGSEDPWMMRLAYLGADAARSKRSSTDADLDTACEPAEFKRVIRASSWSASLPASSWPASLPASSWPASLPASSWPASLPASRLHTSLPASLPTSHAFASTCCSHVSPSPYPIAMDPRNNHDPYNLASSNLALDDYHMTTI
jgi:hypothetical protein